MTIPNFIIWKTNRGPLLLNSPKHATVETSGLPKSAPKTFNQIMESLDESQEETACAPVRILEKFFSK